MFATFRRFRRQTAVLAVLSLLASVLVAVPAVAADDPKPSLEATFTACVDVPESDFEDVPAAHSSAGDIDCIAYYGITKGTSATTYSPTMSVTREHMALFLTRLAGLVGIEMASDPDDAGFTDIGDLSARSQTAINQLADLEITVGYGSTTTYAPAESVKRGHMALFIARLMDLMTPYGGDKSTDAHTPSDVDDLDSDDVGSPFTDLGSATKETYDAITALYELGVVSGISDTSYAPGASITRAAMAEFMVGAMDHSNLRPAGLSIQASNPSSFGVNEGDAVVSVRDDSFVPVADQVVDIFEGDLDEDGACDPACVWDDGTDEELTDEDGNIVSEGGAARGKTATYYAWIGTEDDEEFDVDDTDHVSVMVESKNEELAMKVTTSISDNADGETADLDKGGSVTVTVQLVDTAQTTGDNIGQADADAKDVARSGIEITVAVTRQSNADSGELPEDGANVVFSSTDVTTLTTDDDGTATYVVDAPEDDDDKDDDQLRDADPDATPPIEAITVAAKLENRVDTITFSHKDGGAGDLTDAEVTILWKEDNPVTTSASSSAAAYVIPDKGDVVIRTSITLYDQYGNGIREAGVGQMAAINIGTDTADNDNVAVNRNGVATRRLVVEDVDDGVPIAITYDERPQIDNEEQTDVTEVDDADDADDQSVQVVFEADDDNVGAVVVNSVDTDDNEFLANSDATGTLTDSGPSDLVFSYDADDTFVNGVSNGEDEGELITMEKFVEMISGFDDEEADSERAVVDVIVYESEGSSIFRVTNAAGVPSS